MPRCRKRQALPRHYTGAGTGIHRALEDGLQVEFKNDERTHEFLITIERKEDLDTTPSVNEATPDTTPSVNKVTPDTTPSVNKVTPDTTPSVNKVTPDTTPSVKRPKLTKKQKDIINFCSVPRSSREIFDRLGLKYHHDSIKRYITDLVEAGYLERTIPERPSDMNQKYRKK